MTKNKFFSRSIKQLIFVATLFIANIANAQTPPPTITSFSPTSGAVGSTVTITGTGFDSTPSNNVVTIGGTKAIINSSLSSNTTLVVTVPLGQSNEKIVVSNTTTGLTASSKHAFQTTRATPTLFFPTQLNVTTTDPAGIKAADFNGDGLLDFAVVNKQSGKVSIYTNNSSGSTTSFNTTPTELTGFVAGQVWFIDAVDFDGDAKIDIAVQDYGSSKIHVFRNTTTGTTLSFQFVASYTSGSSTEGLDLGDMNGDGKVDILTGNYSYNSVSFLRNTSTIGTISFATVQDFNSLGNTTCVVAGDIDGDGKNDIVSGPWSGVFKTLLNTTADGATTLSLSTAVDKAISGNPWGIELADLDLDGDLDVIFNSGGVRIFLNNSTPGSVSYSSEITLSANGYKLSLGDINGDGKTDILVFTGAGLTIYTNNYTSGTFSSSSFSNTNYAHSLATGEMTTPFIGDFNNDGKYDIGLTGQGSGKVGILLSGVPPIITASNNTLSTITNCKTPRVIADHTNVGGASINLDQNDLYYNWFGNVWALYKDAATGNYHISLVYSVATDQTSVNNLFVVNPNPYFVAGNFPGANPQVQFNQNTGEITLGNQTYQVLPKYETFTVSGANLTAGLIVRPPANFQVSTDQTTWIGSTTTPTAITLSPSTGTVASTLVYVRTVPNIAANSYASFIQIRSVGAADADKVVAATILAPTVFTSQATATVNLCQNASYTLAGGNATGSGTLSRQWFSNTTNSNTGGTSLGSANFAQTGGLQIVTTTPGTYYYYLVVTGACATAVSNVSTITISPTAVAGTASTSSNTVCSGATTTISLANSTGSIQWQQSANNSTWVNVTGGTGATTANYTTPALVATTYYRAVVTSGVCTVVNSNVVTLTVPPAPRPFKQALNFDGASDKVVVANNATQQLPNTLTIEAWVKVDPSVAIGSAYMGIATKVTWAASGLGYGLDIDGGKPRIFSGQGYSNWSGAGSPNNIATNTWVHLAGTYDGSSFKMYVDGQLVATQASGTGVSNNTQPFTIGSWSGENKFFKGDIDEVRVWNVARSAAQIQQYKDVELNGNESGLVSYYDFNQGTPAGTNTSETTAIDKTTNASTGTLNTFALTGASSNWIAGGPLILSAPSLCLNSTTTLTHTNSGGTWSSSNASVLSINSSTGEASANAVGTATITYTFSVSGCTYTSTKLFTVLDLPAITAHPATTAQDVCLNGTATALSLTATGAGLTYQWYKNTTAANTGGTLISGATSASYTPLTTAAGDAYYYCIVSGTCSPAVTSNVSGLIKVYALSAAGTISSSVASVCDSGSATLTLTGSAGTIQWQRFASPIWIDLNGATTASYTTAIITQNQTYRAIVTNGPCSSSTTAEFTVQVNASPAAPTATTTVNYCVGATATALTVTATSGYSLKWYTVAAGGTANTTAPTPTASTAGTTTYYVSQLQNSSTISTSTSAGTTASYVSGLNLGQTFQVATTSKVNSISIGQIFAYSPIMTMKIYAGFGGTLLGTADATMTGSGYFNPVFTFANSSVILTANQTYYFEVTSSNSVSFYLMSVKNNYTSTGVLYQNNVANSALDYDYTITSSSIANPCESPRTAITVNVNEIPTISGVQNMTVGGSTLQLIGSGTPDATTPWVSSATGVVTISTTGVVTAVGAGTTTITYKNASGCVVTQALRVVDCTQPFGNALAFGVGTSVLNADFVQVNSRIFPSQSVTSFTIETWIKPAASDIISGTTGSTWLSFIGYFGTRRSPALYITNNGVLHASWQEGSTFVGTPLSAPTSLVANKWTHVALVKDGTTMRLFVDGVQLHAVACLATLDIPDNAYWLGKTDVQFNGTLDEVRFWSTARTQAQIQSAMNTELAGNETGLLTYFDFNQGIAGGNNATITTVINKANNALNGTLTNFTKTGTSSNFVGSTISNLDIIGAAIVCTNSTSQFTHPIAGGTWAVSNGAAASVSNTGLITSGAAENLSISYTYTLNGCSFVATKAIVVQAPVISGNTQVGAGNQITLTATTTAATTNAWVSSSPSVATVSTTGVVSGLTLGNTTITYTNSLGCTATQAITVVAGTTQTPVLTLPATNTSGVTTFQFSYTLPEAPLAGSVKLTFTPTGGGTPIVWSMTNATSATFSHVVGSNPLATNPNNVLGGTALPFTTYNVTLSYQDAFGNPVASATNTNIQTLSAPNISFASVNQDKVVNVAISIVTINTGAAATFTILPALPANLSINAATGLITGTVTAPLARRSYTVTATNSMGTSTATFNLFIDSDMDGDGTGDATDADIDGDGIPNTIEIQDGSNPADKDSYKDTDGDGVPDYIEVRDGTSPTNPADGKDTDGDGVPDYIELRDGTNPAVPGAKDTDGDGVPDYIEVRDGTSPTTPGDAKDTDGDGVPDYIERRDGTNPSNPADAVDTDGDGLSNYYEANNAAPTNISVTPASISENNAIGAVVGSLTSTDAGDIYAHGYTLVSGTGSTNNASFTILGDQLKAAVAFDFETKANYSIRVRSTDIAGLFYEKVLTVTILDVVENVAPTNISLSASSINENNIAGAVVGNLSSTDADAGDTHTYTLVTGAGSTDNSSFTILGNQLKATPVFDFETKSSYSVRVRSTDAGGLSFEKVFTIMVNDLNEAPTDLALSATAVNENVAANTQIGTLSSTDTDAGSTFTYTLVTGTGSTDNAAFNISGNSLRITASPDFETKSSYSVRVRTTDAGGLSFEKVFTIMVNDLNEAPTDLALSATAVNENVAANTQIGTLSSTDTDAGSTFTYTLVTGTGSTDNAAFNISGNSLRITASPDFETKSSYAVRIRTTDAGGLSFEKVFTITVNNLNEAPTNLALSNANVFENNATGATIGLLSSTDPDAGSVFTYSLVSGDVSAFTLTGNTLKANTVFNFANKNNYTVRIRTTDAGGLSFDKDFTVTVSQVPVITGTGNQVGTTIPTPASTAPEISKGFSSQLSVIGSGYTSYSWSPATGLSSTNIANPIARPLQTTTYTLTVTNALGNTATASITVIVNPDYYLASNNILTPNGDGQNDTWVVDNLSNYPNHEVKIFDRNGRLLFNTKNYQNNWNGQVNGAMLASGTYYYTITFGTNVAPKKGFITLVR